MVNDERTWLRASRAGSLAGIGGVTSSCAAHGASNGNDAQIQADVTKALDNKQFKDVEGSGAERGCDPDRHSGRYTATRRTQTTAHHRKNVKGVQNMIEVAGPTVEDVTLRDKLAEKLTYDRVGYGTTAFNSLRSACRMAW